MRLFSLLILLLLASPLWGQQHYVVDPNFADLGNRYYKRIIGIEYEPWADTYMVAGTFAGGTPFTPCLNRINDLGEDDFFWDVDEVLENCSGVLNNFFRVPNGYRLGANMIKLNDLGVPFNETIPDFTGTDQITVSSPYGWGDDNGAVYVGSNWRLLEEDGQPETGLLAFTPQGERFLSFPLVQCEHPDFTTYISDVYPYDEERIILGGGFNSLNGHPTVRMGRIFKNGTIDTSFSSELEPHFKASAIDVDPQGRILVYHVPGGSEETPNDEIEIWRLMPDGSIDPSWNLIDLDISPQLQGGGSARNTVRFEDGSYLIYGRYNFVNGVPRSSICHVDSSGNLLETFADLPFSLDTESQPQLQFQLDDPQINDIVRTPDGGILVAGIFTHYQDQPYLNLIKLIPDPLSTNDRDFSIKAKVFPNPAKDQITLKLSNPRQLHVRSVVISDISGRTVASYPWRGETQTIDIGHLAGGVYLLQLRNEGTVLGVEKLVVH